MIIIANDATNTIIRQTDKDTSDLKEHEKTIIEFLSSFAEDGDISIGYVGKRSHRKQYLKFLEEWRKQASEETPDTWKKKYFDNRGSNLLLYLTGIFFLLFIVLVIVTTFNLMPSYLAGVLTVAMFIFMFLSLQAVSHTLLTNSIQSINVE